MTDLKKLHQDHHSPLIHFSTPKIPMLNIIALELCRFELESVTYQQSIRCLVDVKKLHLDHHSPLIHFSTLKMPMLNIIALELYLLELGSVLINKVSDVR